MNANGNTCPRQLPLLAAALMVLSLSALDSSAAILVQADSGIGALRPATMAPATSAQYAAQLKLAADDALEIFVIREGWYRIAKAQMVAAGFDPGTNAKQLSLFCQGVEQPIVVNTAGKDFQANDTVEFYGLGLDTPATGARTYWLRAGKGTGKRFATGTGGSAAALTGSVPFTYQRIDRSVWVPQLLDTGDGENFFGPVITPDPVSQELTVAHHDAAAATDATLEATIRGGTENIDHLVRVELNGQLVGVATVPNTQQLTFTYAVSHNLLASGANTLTLTALNGWDDISTLAVARLTYRHLLVADDGLLEVDLPAGRQVTIRGYPNGTIRALDVTDPLAPQALAVTVAADAGSFKATLSTPGSAGARTVLVFSANRVLAPSALQVNQPSGWTSRANQVRADLVIVTNRAFADAAASLRAARVAQGLETVVVDVDDIYDEMNFGVRSPEAMRRFLAATRDWKKAPGSVILLGDASIDPRNYLEMGAFDFVPTKLVPTLYLKTAADGWLTDFDNDGVEDIPIGRLPARTAGEAAALVARVTARDSGAPAGDWSKTAVMIADVPETWDFPAAASALAAQLPADMRPFTKSISIGATATPRNDIVAALNSGSLIVDYIGHASTEIWSSNVFNSNDAMSLTNGQRQPFVLAMTCLNAYFHDLFTHSLAEALMSAPNGGAIAVWSSSTLTEPEPQFAMNQELYLHLFDPHVTIGQAIIAAKKATTALDVRQSWNLIGDPTLHLVR